MNFSLISLGCPKNLVDSERIIAQLATEGLRFTDSLNHARCVILNTCGFIKPAIDETLSEIKKLVAWKTAKANRKIFVCGCLVNRMKKQLTVRFPQVDGWLKIEDEGKIAGALGFQYGKSLTDARFLTTPKHFAYLKIAEGCRNRCTYCTIPDIRGPLRSRKIESILKEAKSLAAMGIKELIIIAQDTTNYGVDIYRKKYLSHLINLISKIDGIKWIRILYGHPAHVDEGLIEEIAANPKVCKYLDMPIQHINNRILKLMNRRCNRKKIEAVIDKLRMIPGMAIRTTIIAGFPTETKTEFQELLEFVKTTNFDHLGFFPYYREKGTGAARLPQVAGKEKIKRLNLLIETQLKNVEERFSGKIGDETTMVVDRIYKSMAYGHSEHETPEIDRQISVKDDNLKIGNFYRVRINGFNHYDLCGSVAVES